MKQSLILCMVFFSISVFSFSQKISLTLGEVKLSEALRHIKKEAHVDFFYSDKELNVNQSVTVNFDNLDTLEAVSKLVGEDFKVEKTENNIILISPSEGKINSTPLVQQQTITVTGVVTDQYDMPLPGVTVIMKEQGRGTITNFDGEYSATNVDPESTLVFSYVGYKKVEVKIDGRTEINLKMEEDIEDLSEVVITGVVRREKKSFTGATTTASREELKAIGNTNVLQSLRTLDPSFNIVDNNLLGSDPNALPEIEVRGKTSISNDDLRDEFGNNPNQPLFILDGFPTTLQQIVDLDMNRVSSITILKDASSTALYGAQAANGVIVVETIRPREGQIQITYTGDLTVEMPDLSDYNLMNSTQKLEYERLAGRWTGNNAFEQFQLDRQYNTILAEIKRGVNTYWLNEPLQVGTAIRNSVYASGGSETLTFGAGFNLRSQDGVMIGSKRNNWGANVDLTYRKNKFNITNRLYINGVTADNSPYGGFSDYTRANPYFRVTDAEGRISRFLNIGNIFTNQNIANPLYNSTLRSYGTNKTLTIINNFRAQYTLSNKFRLEANFQLTGGNTTDESFTDPDHPSFAGASPRESGAYSNSHTNNFSYRFNAMATYADVFAEKHKVTGSLRTELEETNNDRLTITALGFPPGTNGNPAFSFGYTPGGKPNTNSRIYRRVNVLGSANYSFDNKLFVDATYRIDGSTAFGSNEKYSPFWSVGAGWNIHEQFGFDEDIVSLLKLRGNIGETGNQGFGDLTSTSIYTYATSSQYFGQSTILQTVANPDLEWQNTIQSSFGLDATLLNNRINFTANLFFKNTDPLIARLNLPSSTGIVNYPVNVGHMKTTGFETTVRVSPIYDLENDITWTLGFNSVTLENVYGGFGNKLETLDDSAQENRSLFRYRDGYSPDDLWAVPSLGIDPSNGREVFLNKDGLPTYEYNIQDEKVMGNGRPTLQGIITSNFRYKDFTFGMNFRYTLGGDRFNSAAFQQIENISENDRIYNQDVRALTSRWLKPGDIASYKSITNFDNTPISSRFIQKENTLSAESINIGYQFRNRDWMRKIGLERLRLTAYMNEIFRFSTIRIERGLTYPFARSLSFSLNASF
ncbi:SusC/RagA family TonB-linked outer membrane protein [Gaetbulibacter saemankumensis]|uniref:SusC/RagA family TonB-linked outer membrane protein n=1 Tax=Gaetbulibacter saemankumensis TaxID=311208 RepID=UPI00146E6CAC|nr:SusC/RagA family TonB-linked outer membrane protein [Gaetbulibacter saemankumensis]